VLVVASVAQTTGWAFEGDIVGTSATAGWVTGRLICDVDAQTASLTKLSVTNVSTITPTSNTGLTTTSTLDLRFDTSASVVTDVINVHSVTMERLN